MALIKPYYRDSQLSTIDTIVENIDKNLINKTPSDKQIEDTSKLVIGNSVCALVFNEKGQVLYDKNPLGEICMLNNDIVLNDEEINIEENPRAVIDLLKQGEIEETLVSSSTGLEMLLYGKTIKTNLANYYLILNTALEPVESYIDFIMNQYLYIAISVVIIAIVIAFFLARKITRPIVLMEKQAHKLAEGQYDISFKSDSYTEINDLANSLDDATNKLSKVDELRKDLVANVSHDIKTPLTIIQSYAEMIKDISGDDPQKREEHLNVIIQETEYLNKLVTDMQEYSKMQAGLIQLNKENFDLEENIEKVISLLDKVIQEKEIQIQKNLIPKIIYGDEMKMSQVIYNFLSNAIKHSSNQSIIQINMIESEDKIRVEVVDHGDGIAEENLPYIWDRYYKIDKGFNRNQNSTGLGLAIAKAILEAHHAKYGVTSKVNEGSTFYFELNTDYEEEQ